MPRKQRFKPSRKPKTIVEDSSQQIGEQQVRSSPEDRIGDLERVERDQRTTSRGGHHDVIL